MIHIHFNHHQLPFSLTTPTTMMNITVSSLISYDVWPNLLLTLVAVVAISSWIYIKWVSSMSSAPLPPGPAGLPVVGSLPFLSPELHAQFSDLARTYGPIFKLRLGTKLAVVASSPSAASEILRLHDATFANRDITDAGRAATYGGSDIVWTLHGPVWRMLRKVCVREMLSNKTLDSVYRLRRREVRETVRYLRGRAGSPVNVGEQMFLTMLNVITSMMWGSTVEREGGEFRQLVQEMTAMLGAPNVSDFFPAVWLFDLQGVRKRVDAVAKRLDGVFQRIIQQRLAESPEAKKGRENDFLQFLLGLIEEGAGEGDTTFTITHLKALLMDMVVGGSDTTSNSVEFAMAEVMNKPQVMTKIRQELDNVVGTNNIVEESHIHKLPYLQAVMKETLRLHPTLPLLVPHMPSKTCTISGHTVPEGSRVFVNVWAIQRDPSVWDSPLEFKPERFLSGKWDFSGSDFKYFPFGSGRRICAGVALAERMLMYSLATLLHSFDWELPEGSEELDLSEKFGIVMKKKVPLVAVLTPRLAHAALYE